MRLQKIQEALRRARRAALWTALAGCSAGPAVEPQDARTALPERPHIVFVLTDDQRFDTLPGVAPDLFPQDVFPRLAGTLMREGLVFTAAYNSNPLCAPSRANLLAGGVHSHGTGVLRNQWPNGSAQSFDDASSLGVHLQRAGYRTAFIGKYPNGHSELTGRDAAGRAIERRRYVPPGWDLFVHRDFTATWWRHALTIGSSGPDAPARGLWLPPEAPELAAFASQLARAGAPARAVEFLAAYDVDERCYVTNYERDLALALLADVAESSEPWFVLVAVESPHQPAEPDLPDRGVYAGYRYRGRGFGETDLSDKPEHVARAAERLAHEKPTGPYATPDELWQGMLESLRSIDRLVGALCDALDADPRLAARSAIFFSSDNGLMWGEHGLRSKRAPYEESIRAPLVARLPGVGPGLRTAPVAVDLDLPATFLALAGVDAEERERLGCDGASLLELFSNPAAAPRAHVFCESFGTEALGLNFEDSTWVLHQAGSIKVVLHDYLDAAGRPVCELYDLERDPFELESRAGDPALRAHLERAAAELELERGLALVGLCSPEGELPSARAGEPYAFAFAAAGGTPPVRFALFEGAEPEPSAPEVELGLPSGLALSAAGTLAGAPARAGLYEFVVALADASRSPQHGGPQTYTRRARLRVLPADEAAERGPADSPDLGPAPEPRPAVDPRRSSVRAAPGPFPADGAAAAEVEIRLCDALGRPLAGRAVALAAGGRACAEAGDGPSVEWLGGGPVTDEEGRARALVRSRAARCAPLCAAADPGPGACALLEQPAIAFEGDRAHVALERSAAWAAGGGARPREVALAVRDVFGNPVPGAEVELALGPEVRARTTDAHGRARAEFEPAEGDARARVATAEGWRELEVLELDR